MMAILAWSSALVLLAAGLVLLSNSWAAERPDGLRWHPRDPLLRASSLAVFVVVGMLVAGVVMAGRNAAWACVDLPACRDGVWLPPGPLARINILYRALLLATAGMIWWTTWRVLRTQQPRAVQAVAVLVSGLALATVVGFALLVALLLLDRFPTFHLVLGGMVGLGVVALRAMLQRIGRPTPVKKRMPRPEEVRATWGGLVRDYVMLTKPRVISLLILTTLAAMLLAFNATYPLSFPLVLWTLVGGYLAAGGANAINMYMDRDVDALMGRTSRRPLPSSRMEPEHALRFGLILNVLAFVILTLSSNLLAATLAVGGSVFYVLVYTRLLKRATPHNIVIGGAAGAVPPLVGWVAVRGELDLVALLLFAIIFYWTPPHFWALALMRRADYARAGIPMLPVARGEQETKWQILLYSLLMVMVSVLPAPLLLTGPLYLLLATLLGLRFLQFAVKLFREPGTTMAWPLYKYSLLYLALLFGALVVDHLVMLSLA